MTLPLATPFIDWSALGKIALVSLFAGAGVVILFGILLLGLREADQARNTFERIAAYALSGICGLVCIAVVVVGIYAMAHKPSSKPAPKGKSAATPALRTAL